MTESANFQKGEKLSISQTENNERSDGLMRLPEVLKMIPVSKSTWWEGVRAGKYPQPIKVGPRITCWRRNDIAEIVKNGVDQERKEKAKSFVREKSH